MSELDRLSLEQRTAFEALAYRLNAEADAEERRQCTRLGYRLGGVAGLAASAGIMLFISVAAAVVLALLAPSLHISLLASPVLFWSCFIPVLSIPALPFVFMKPRYTVKPLVFMAVVFVVTVPFSGFGGWLLDHIFMFI